MDRRQALRLGIVLPAVAALPGALTRYQESLTAYARRLDSGKVFTFDLRPERTIHVRGQGVSWDWLVRQVDGSWWPGLDEPIPCRKDNMGTLAIIDSVTGHHYLTQST